MILSGNSIIKLVSVHYEGSGGIILSGISFQVSPSWHYEGEG